MRQEREKNGEISILDYIIAQDVSQCCGCEIAEGESRRAEDLDGEDREEDVSVVEICLKEDFE
jgi:hypothetical protein